MKCKCGSDMRVQTQGVWFCIRGDYFAVEVLASKDPDAPTVQWYKKEGELEHSNTPTPHRPITKNVEFSIRHRHSIPD